MTAVAVWDHRPTADELLAARLESGWQPRASQLRDGSRILGYAACTVERSAGRGSHEPRESD